MPLPFLPLSALPARFSPVGERMLMPSKDGGEPMIFAKPRLSLFSHLGRNAGQKKSTQKPHGKQQSGAGPALTALVMTEVRHD
jgi:hypothetical protein